MQVDRVLLNFSEVVLVFQHLLVDMIQQDLASILDFPHGLFVFTKRRLFLALLDSVC